MTDTSQLLVATDFSARSERALSRALELAQGGRLTVLHVMKPELPDDLAQVWRKAAQAYLDKRLGDLAASGSADVEGVVVARDAFGAIIGEAARRRAGLIVIGAPAWRGYADMFVGTTAERVIRFSNIPVLMVRREAAGPYLRILSAFDGSDGSVRALKAAVAIAPKAEFRIVHAWRPPQASAGDAETARSAIQRENESLKPLIHKAATDALSPAGGSLVIDMIEDNPFVAMRNQTGSADLLVLGTHSKGRLATTLSIGSLARHLLAEAACDVLVSRP
jgi:nucleotide-binding universal stress UspA family protein